MSAARATLRPAPTSGIVPGVENEALAAQVAALAELVANLTVAVGGLAAERTHAAASGAPASPTPALVKREFSPLVEITPDDFRWTQRWELAMRGDLTMTQADVLCRLGGRGFYRSGQGQKVLHERGVDFRRAIIADASLEDPAEAARMGADLMKDWGLGSEPPR